jgi:RNA 2',3'-cyclic 3'-phosphodiesterase
MNITRKLFVGIKVSPDNYLMDFIYKIREDLSAEEIKWSKPTNFHITLKFIGDVDSIETQIIEDKLEKISNSYKSFELAISGLGIFRSITFPRVLYAGVDAADTVFKLNKDLNHIFADSLGLGIDNKFSPHVTLGRMKKFTNRDLLKSLLDENRNHELLRVKVSEIILFESLVKNESREYVPLSIYRLKN